MKISKILQTLFLAASVATLAACGGGSTTVPTPVATSNASIALNPTTGPAFLQALNGQSFSFPGGVPELGTAGPTTVSFFGRQFHHNQWRANRYRPYDFWFLHFQA